MEILLKVVALGILTALLVTVLKKQSPETALLLSVAACILIAILLASKILTPLLGFFEELQKLTGLNGDLLAPVVKSVAIGFLTQFGSAVCADAGQGAIARLVELCGGVLAVSVALPLFEAVLELIGNIGGGG